MDGESEEHDGTDGEEVSVHFGDMSHLAEIPKGLSYGVYKAGSLYLKIREYLLAWVWFTYSIETKKASKTSIQNHFK